MPRDVVVLFVHGINTTCQDYYVPLRDLIVERLSKEVGGHAIFRAVFWADIVRGRQQEYIHYAKQLGLLEPHSMHRLVLEGLGDAAAYQKTDQRRNSAYYEIQRRIQKVLTDAALPGEDVRPLIVIAHSLGCHIMSSFAWDLLKEKHPDAFRAAGTPSNAAGEFEPTNPTYGPAAPPDDGTRRFRQNLSQMSPFAKLDTLAGLVTLGNNMPLFTFVFGPQHVFPISRVPDHVTCPPAFPGCRLDDGAKACARWINLYSRNDPLGYPLKPLNDAYDEEKLIQDVKTKSEYYAPRTWGDWFTMTLSRRIGLREGLALQAHVGYWRDPVVADHAATLIKSIVNSDNSAQPTERHSEVSLFPGLPPSAP